MPNAVITGATKGMGRAIAEKLIREGWNLAVCARTEPDLKAMTEQWQQQCPERRVVWQAVDVSQKSQLHSFSKKVKETFDAVDMLVNNAGVFLPGKLMEEPENQLELMMQTNVYSVVHLTRSLLPALRNSRKAHIFNMCSVASLKAYANGGAYSVSKYALLGFTENLRLELMEEQIRVTAITPGAVWTDSWKHSGRSEDRMIAASDIAELVSTTYHLSTQAVVENIVIRPQLGDL